MTCIKYIRIILHFVVVNTLKHFRLKWTEQGSICIKPFISKEKCWCRCCFWISRSVSNFKVFFFYLYIYFHCILVCVINSNHPFSEIHYLISFKVSEHLKCCAHMNAWIQFCTVHWNLWLGLWLGISLIVSSHLFYI